MKFKVDENLPGEVAEILHEAGFDALTVHDQHLTEEEDSRIASVCQLEKRTLITLDLGFADIGVYPPQNYSGIIVLRLKRQDKYQVLEVCKRLLGMLQIERLEQHLWIVNENRIRVRE